MRITTIWSSFLFIVNFSFKKYPCAIGGVPLPIFGCDIIPLAFPAGGTFLIAATLIKLSRLSGYFSCSKCTLFNCPEVFPIFNGYFYLFVITLTSTVTSSFLPVIYFFLYDLSSITFFFHSCHRFSVTVQRCRGLVAEARYSEVLLYFNILSLTTPFHFNNSGRPNGLWSVCRQDSP